MEYHFHYPPDLINLLLEAIPILSKSKKTLILFFKGSGVPVDMLADIEEIVISNPDSIKKHEIVRIVLDRINEAGDRTLTTRREILKRVTEFEDFSCCWTQDQYKAMALVAQIRKMINVKDSFTRMQQERENEIQKKQVEYQQLVHGELQRKQLIQTIRTDLCSLFSEPNPQIRGKRLEVILNKLFDVYGILIQESFTLVGDNNEGIVEQIDGVVEVDNFLYLVEMKWWKEPIGVPELSQHLVRLFNRQDIRGIFISASGFTSASIQESKNFLSQKILVLIELKEIVLLLEQNGDLLTLIRNKIRQALIYKNPFYVEG